MEADKSLGRLFIPGAGVTTPVPLFLADQQRNGAARTISQDPEGSIGNKESDVLKKTSTRTGLVIVTAAGALLTSSPAYALDSLVLGSHIRIHHRSHHRNRNWNGNRHHGRIYIRIYIYNKNNNQAVAIARPENRHRNTTRIRNGWPIASGMLSNRGGTARRREPIAADLAPASNSLDTTPASQSPATTGQGTASTSPASVNSAPSDSGTASAPGTPGLDEAATG